MIKLNTWPVMSAVALAVMSAVPAWAMTPFVVKDIRVEGLQRVEAGTVFASLPFRVGDQVDDDKTSAAIRALFGLGLFADVRLQADGDVLVILVEERPSVAQISFTGLKEFDNDVMTRALKDIGLSEGRPFDKAMADRAEQELKRQYLSRSMYGAQVQTTVTPVDKNRVNLNFSVTEGQPARIRAIQIVGNRAFDRETLMDQIGLDTGGWLSWYTKSNQYTQAKLAADLEALKSFYLTRGYLEFRVDSTQVAIAPGKDDIEITINVTEGNRYTVSSVELVGEFFGREDEFKPYVSILAGQPYNAERVADTVKAFQDLYGNWGYAFARVNAVPQVDRANNQVKMVLQGQPLQRVFVRRINLEGNNRTRDEVVRREMRQLEAAWYDGDKIRLSRDRIDRLGYFTLVNVQTQPVPNTTDQVDLVVKVEEKPTGNLSIGAGYSQAEGISFVAGIQQDNIFGTGNSLGIDLNTSSFNRQLTLSTTNPYFTESGISRTFDVYYKTTRPYDTQGGDYKLVTPGVGIRFGVPVTETDRVFVGAGFKQNQLSGADLPDYYKDYIAAFGEKSTSIPLTLGWARDNRDSALAPTRGVFQRVNGEWGVGGDTRFLKLNYQYQQYLPLTQKYTLAFNADVGYGKGLSGKDYPVFENFYGGGLGSVRGFEQGTLGEQSKLANGTQVFIGGNRKIAFSTEFIAPMPGSGKDRTLRVFGFVDVGNVYGPDQSVDLSQLRASTGVGLSWLSPVGPLRIAYAKPLRKFDQDKLQTIQFQIGTAF